MKWGNTTEHCWSILVVNNKSAYSTDRLDRLFTALESYLSGKMVRVALKLWVHLPLCSINLASSPATQTHPVRHTLSLQIHHRNNCLELNSNIFNCDVISEWLTWSFSRFFVKETILSILMLEKEVRFKSSGSCPSLVSFHPPRVNRGMFCGNQATVTGHNSAEDRGSYSWSQREGRKKKEERGRSAMLSASHCSV